MSVKNQKIVFSTVIVKSTSVIGKNGAGFAVVSVKIGGKVFFIVRSLDYRIVYYPVVLTEVYPANQIGVDGVKAH